MNKREMTTGRWDIAERYGALEAPREFVAELEQRCLLSNPPFQTGHTIVEMVTSNGTIMVELFDDTAPLTVQNFLNYVNSNHYDNTFFHRLARSFALQGGHFYMGPDGFPLERETNAPVVNEPGHTNSVRTLAMAKLGGDPNSATDQFFFNLNNNNDPNNPDNLDDQNGGFTVFGQVVNGWDTVLEIGRLGITNAGNPFAELPIQDSFEGGTLTEADLVVLNDIRVIASPGWSQQAVSGQVVNGAGSYTTSSMFVTTNSLGRPIAFYQDAGSDLWFVSDIGLETGAPSLTGAIVQWHDRDELNFYAAAPSAQGLLVFKHNADGMWEMRNLTTELAGSLNITGEVTVFKSVDAKVHIAGLNSSGPGGVGGSTTVKLVLYRQTGATANGNDVWEFVNLDDDLAQQGQTTPRFIGQLTSYVTTWNGLNIAGVDGNGDIHTVWWAPGETLWHTDNLSDLTGAPEYNGVITSFVAPWGGINLVGTDKNGKVITTWWSPADPWQTSNLTDLFSGPLLNGSTISSYVTPWGALNIAGTTSTNEIIIYWWAPDTGTWIVSSISNRISEPQSPMSRLTGVSSDAGPISLVGTANNGHILRYFWTPTTDVWAVQDLTTLGRFL